MNLDDRNNVLTGFSSDDEDSEPEEPIIRSALKSKQQPQKQDASIMPIQLARYSVIKGDLETIRKLIEGNEIPVNTPIGDHNWSLLMYAAKGANPEILDFLISNGADPNFRGTFEYSALLALVSTEKPHPDDQLEKCLSILLEAGAEVTVKEKNGLTALHLAVKTNNMYLAKRLIEVGVDKNAVDLKGRTALHHVVLLENRKMSQFLVEAGCDLSIVNNDGCKAYEVAGLNDFQDVASMLYKAESTNWTPGGDPEVLKLAPVSNELVPSKPKSERLLSKGHLIEMDLYNLGLHSLWPLFEKAEIDHFTYVRLTDAQLRDIGVAKVGQRLRILDSLRAGQNQDWLETSLPEINKQKKDGLSTPTTIHMLQNVKEHILYMVSSLKFIETRVFAAPEILRTGKDGMNGDELCRQLELCKGASEELRKDLVSLNEFFVEFDGEILLESGDKLILKPPFTHTLKNYALKLCVIGIACYVAKRGIRYLRS